MMEWNGRTRVARVISLGGGVQSSTLALMVAHGELPRVDGCVFADTHWEPEAVYAHLDWLEREVSRAPHPFPVHRVSAGDLRHAVMTKEDVQGSGYSPIPSHVAGKGMRKRVCTTHYKIRPIEKFLRARYAPRVGKEYVEQWMGISLDEVRRMKDSHTKWIHNVFPLIERRMSRAACLEWFKRRYRHRALVKSACIGCPYHSRAYWRALRRRAPREFADAVAVEQAMQEMDRRENNKISYLHADAIPLAQAVPDGEDNQLPLFGGDDECGGHCFT